MSDLNIQLCPETGICSIVKQDGTKIDLIPNEVDQLREASGKPDAVRQALAQIDAGFAEGLDAADLDQVSNELN